MQFTEYSVTEERPRERQKLLRSLSILLGIVAILTFSLFVVCDQALDSLRVARQVADMWIEADRSACLQLDRCIEVGGTECDLVRERLKRPFAYWQATVERASPQPDIEEMRRQLQQTGIDFPLWRFRYRWFERITTTLSGVEDPAASKARSTGQFPRDLSTLTDLATRARQAHSESPVNASVLATLKDALDPLSASLDRGKRVFDTRAEGSSRRLRSFLLGLVLSSVVVMFGVALWISQRLVRRWEAKEVLYQQRDAELSRSLAQRVDELQQVLHEKGVLFQQLEAQFQEIRTVEAALRRSNQDLQQFAYVASHDLREPLRNVSTHVDLFKYAYKSGLLEEYGEDCLSVMQTGVTRMEALIAGLLTYARLANNMETHIEATDMNSVVEQALSNLRTAVVESKSTIIKRDLPTVAANPIQMTQVFQNMIANSIRYRRPDVPLVIEIESTDAEDGTVFHVRDNGRGFKQEYAEVIFRMFQRLETADVSGTGIGLAICKLVVTQHGGQIWANGRPGEGADFSFTLPRHLPCLNAAYTT